ncbi:MAG: hypothetical protein HWD61_14930 [Parachlamydiaceae bacterium]|nr:MAG: hypothetical protein HWD61_14930 [Parachlamydiaceae bacterium]
MDQFLVLWSTIPSNQELLKPKDQYGYEPDSFYSLACFISELQNYIGISQSTLKELLKLGENRSFYFNSLLDDALFALYKRYPRVYDSLYHHPEETFKDLKVLKVEIDELKKEHQAEIEKRKHPISQFSEALDILLNTPRPVSIEIEEINFEEIKQRAENMILAPLDGISERIVVFKKALAASKKTRLLILKMPTLNSLN